MVIIMIEVRTDGEVKIRGKKSFKTYFEEWLYYTAPKELLIDAPLDYNSGKCIHL